MHFQRHPMGHFAILGAEDALMSDQLSLCPNLTTSQQGTLLALAAKDTPRTGPSFWRNGSLHRSRRWHCPRGVLPARSASPPIHFGREDGVERTLLRVACQSETFLASPWQGDANIRFLWHIGCQSDFDELVSMACRPVDRGFCRMGSVLSFPKKG